MAGYEPLHFYATNAVSNNAGAGTFILNCEIPLGMLYNSIFAVDKDLFFNEVMVLRIVFNGTNRFCFTTPNTASLTDPSGGGNNGASPPTTLAVAPAFNITFQNLMLYLATEQNAAIENELRLKVNSPEGLKILIPYIYTNKLGLPASSSQAVSVRYNRGHGIKLKKIYYSAFNTNENVNWSFDHSNLSNVGVAGYKIQNFYTAIDNIRLQQYNIDCQNSNGQCQDWLEMQKYCKGSIIATSNMYQYNWFWLDDFSNAKSTSQKTQAGLSEDNMVQGLDLTLEKKYDIILNTNNILGLNHYCFAITEKLMIVTPNGIVVQ